MRRFLIAGALVLAAGVALWAAGLAGASGRQPARLARAEVVTVQATKAATGNRPPAEVRARGRGSRDHAATEDATRSQEETEDGTEDQRSVEHGREAPDEQADGESDQHEDPDGQDVNHECPPNCDTANGEQP
jgi:hypothetical protein